jgi:putative transposase
VRGVLSARVVYESDLISGIDLPTVRAERLTPTHPDVLRELLTTFIHSLICAEVDALCGAGYGDRTN